MPSLRALGHAILCLLLLAVPARATWSILIIDLATGEVAIGIATCLTGFDLRPQTVVVVPGFGVAAAQSFVGPVTLRELIRAQLLNGTPTAQILAMLAAADPGHQTRQYGIASVTGGTITFTGTGAGAWAGGLTGQTGTLVYTVQGNVLTGAPVITAAEQAILTTAGTIGDKMMAAMEAARLMGGDGRCSCTTGGPTACGSPPPNFTKSAHIGLMITSRPGDLDPPCNGTFGCAAGQYYMMLNVANQPATAPDPVIQLRTMYNTWRAQQQGRPDHFQSTVAMSGLRLRANGIDTLTGTVVLRDAQGAPLGNSLPVTVGLNLHSTVGGVTFGPAVPQPNGSYAFTMSAYRQVGQAILDVAVTDPFGRVVISPLPQIQVEDPFGPCGTGAVPNGAGGALDALRIDGSAGLARVLDVGYAQPFALSIDPPAGVPPAFPVGMFALWAHLGTPAPGALLPLGPLGGAMCFTPAPFAAAPTLLVADSIGLGGYYAATAAPWQVQFPGVPGLFDVALQGAMAIDAQGTVAATNAVLLHVVALPQPTITVINPPAPSAGATVTVTGTNFFSGLQLAVAGLPTPLLSRTATQLTFAAPAGLPCDSQITVANPGGSPVSAAFNATPVVTTMPFTSGPAAGGALFLVSGFNMLGATVTFNGAPMSVTSHTATAIFGTTPPGSPGVAQVVISNANGCQVLRQYTYL